MHFWRVEGNQDLGRHVDTDLSRWETLWLPGWVWLWTVWFVATILVAQLTWLVRWPASPLVWFLAASLAAAFALRRRYTLAQTLMLLAAAALGLAAALYLGRQIADVSWDGQSYHQADIFLFRARYNFIWGLSHFRHDRILRYWPYLYFPKGAEIVAAALAALARNVEAAKGLHWIWGSVAAAHLYRILRLRAWPRGRAVVLALLLLLNPFWAGQVWSFYLDGMFYASWLLLFAFFLYPHRLGKEDWLQIGVASYILWHTKNSGPLLWLATMALLGLWRVATRKEPLRVWLKTPLVLLVVLFALSPHPYQTNLVLTGNPLAPLQDPAFLRAANLNQQSPEMRALPHWQKIWYAWFAAWPTPWHLRPFANWHEYLRFLCFPCRAVPHPNLLAGYKAPDTRLNSWGPYFGVMVLGLLLYFFWQAFDARRWPWGAVLVWLVGWGSVLVSPVAWWLRFVPHAWALALSPLLWKPRGRGGRALWWLLAALTFLNVALPTQRRWQYAYDLSVQREHFLATHPPSEPYVVSFSFFLGNINLLYDHHYRAWVSCLDPQRSPLKGGEALPGSQMHWWRVEDYRAHYPEEVLLPAGVKTPQTPPRCYLFVALSAKHMGCEGVTSRRP